MRTSFNFIIPEKFFFSFVVSIGLGLSGLSQNSTVRERFETIENNIRFTNGEKLLLLYRLEAEADSVGIAKDIVYAKMLSKIGLYEFLEHENYDKAVEYTQRALSLNKKLNSPASRFEEVGNYFNLGFYYDRMHFFSKALNYYDSTIVIGSKVSGRNDRVLDARLGKIYIYFRIGDYQRGVEESTGGIVTALSLGDSLRYIDFLNQRGQAFFFQDESKQALADIQLVIPMAKRFHQPYRLASAFKMKGFIEAKNKNFGAAEADFLEAVRQRKITESMGQIAGDYNDLANFCFDSLKNFQKARTYYQQGIYYAEKADDSIRLARLSLNLGRTFINENGFPEAEKYLLQAFAYLRIHEVKGVLQGMKGLSVVQTPNLNKELLIYLLQNKTFLLLRQYEQRKEKSFLNNAVHTALVTDSVITQLRHEQVGEQSKLYWRDRTRDFFAAAIRVCYLNNDAPLAFYFMEKSRAVLLSDKLKEIGAAAHLSEDDSRMGQLYTHRVAEAELKIRELSPYAAGYETQRLQLIQAKDSLLRYIKNLEQKYPVYYQYKYADRVPTISYLQTYLKQNDENFVHYFVGDSLIYMLAISPDRIKMLNMPSKGLMHKLAELTAYCSDKQRLNNDYSGFIAVSQQVYQNIFKPLELPPGRVILCTDNFLFPFEALIGGKAGSSFLVNDYAFSYVYSAEHLLKSFDPKSATGNFVGFAPVAFSPYLKMPELKQSAFFLKQSASYYNKELIYTDIAASRANFMKIVSSYNIVNVFSHAVADTGNTEPLLYFQDSVLYLSDLQLLNRPATRFIMLSACQTNVGKYAAGEGVYSLARGFASVGIPAVAATLWKADEKTVYEISEKLNEYLAGGMRKDEALQKAKLLFMANGGKEKSLPYYWANMVLMGNPEPVQLIPASGVALWFKIAIAILIISLTTFVVYFYKDFRK